MAQAVKGGGGGAINQTYGGLAGGGGDVTLLAAPRCAALHSSCRGPEDR